MSHKTKAPGRLRQMDAFGKNIIVVFIGTSAVNAINFLYQLFVAHSFSSADFAAFNALISIYMLFSTPLTTFQTVIVKHCAEFSAQGKTSHIRVLLGTFLKSTLIFSAATFVVFYVFSVRLLHSLKISFDSAGVVLALLLASCWLLPVFSGGLQGTELFGWYVAVTVSAGVIKLALTYLFVTRGFAIDAALLALLISSAVAVMIYLVPLRRYISFFSQGIRLDYRKIILYVLPVTVASTCYIILVSSDMVLVKFFFSREEAGSYALAQMVGKVFLFLPAAVSIVLMPRTSGLRARKSETIPTLRFSLVFAAVISILAIAVYNIAPQSALRVLTGKADAESVFLGRLFSVSMTFFTLLYILITYFLSIEDLRFIRYLAFFTLAQTLAVCLFHPSPELVQYIMCINAISLFCIHMSLAFLRPIRTA